LIKNFKRLAALADANPSHRILLLA